jgi:hypothetical protein
VVNLTITALKLRSLFTSNLEALKWFFKLILFL